MKNVTAFICLVIGISVIFPSCKKEQDNPGDKTNTVILPAGGDAVVQANNMFAFNFLHTTLQEDKEDNNKLISPLSVYLALSMTYNGAANATKDSISRVLQLSGIDINTLNAVCQSLITQLPGEDNRVELSIANSIWYNQSSQPLPSFLATVQNSYNATVQPADFGVPSTAGTINKWVADQTHNKIKEIFQSVSPDDLMYLINAIYFKGAWQTKFSSSNTRNGSFYTRNGTITVPFMTNEFTTRIHSDSLFTLLELPYGGGKSYSLFIALPTDRQASGNALASSLTETMLTNAMNDMDSNYLRVKIPKWEYNYNIADMQPVLSLLGMGNAFGTGADFSNMYNSQVQASITKAMHETYIKVDEEGTEAAAVTVVGIGTTASLPNSFTADHPFVYAIVEKQTGAILFTGILNAPPVE